MCGIRRQNVGDGSAAAAERSEESDGALFLMQLPAKQLAQLFFQVVGLGTD